MRIASCLLLAALTAAGCVDPSNPEDMGADAGAEPALPDTVTFETRWGPVERSYVIVDGDVIVEGDISVGRVAEVFGPDSSRRSAGKSRAYKRWPNGRVPFTKDPALSSSQSNKVDGAIAHWEANTRIDFVAHTNEADFVTFKPWNQPFCQSTIGVKAGGGEQFIKVASWLHCDEGTIIHEIGHTVGLFHEHTRADRDAFVNIHEDCVDPVALGDFDKYPESFGRDLGAYDFDSRMHYEDDQFYLNGPNCVGNKTITRWDGQNLNPSSDLSPGDLEGVERLYGKRHFAGVAGSTGDRFGTACATGDFDSDGHADLIVGSPQALDDELLPFLELEIGLAHVYQGIDHDRRVTSWHEVRDRLAPDQNDGRFGRAFAVADFDNDGYDDVAIGAPHTAYGGLGPNPVEEAGEGSIHRGTEDGLEWFGIFMSTLIGGGNAETGARLGWSLAAGDFDNDGIMELAIGSPGEKNNAGWVTGMVHIAKVDPVLGYVTGWDHLSPAGTMPQEFGHSLAVGDFNDDGFDDLAVGAPERISYTFGPGGMTATSSGGVLIYLGSVNGMTFAQALDQSGVSPEEPEDRFGDAIAAGDLDHSGGPDDLAVGAPGESVNGHPGAGRVYFFDKIAGAGMVLSDFLDGDSPTVLSFEPTGAEDGDNFGSAFTTGTLPYGGSLAVGAPGDGDELRPGRVYTVATLFGNYGATGMWREAPLTVEENGDRFGAGLCAGDFANNGVDDLVVGAPYGQTSPVDLTTDPDVGTAFVAPNLGPLNVIYR